ncbi:MAG: hypothetical protein Kow0031_07440 [Anaerolineae bacterium]
MAKLIFLANLGATLYMVGLIWFVQIVHYPLFSEVQRPDFGTYEALHSQLTTLVVMPPMLIELGTAILLLWFRPAQLPGWSVWLGLALVLLIWASTFFLQVPQHTTLAAGFDDAAHRFLVISNWLRTAAWSLRGLLVLWWTALLIS